MHTVEREGNELLAILLKLVEGLQTKAGFEKLEVKTQYDSKRENDTFTGDVRIAIKSKVQSFRLTGKTNIMIAIVFEINYLQNVGTKYRIFPEAVDAEVRPFFERFDIIRTGNKSYPESEDSIKKLKEEIFVNCLSNIIRRKDYKVSKEASMKNTYGNFLASFSDEKYQATQPLAVASLHPDDINNCYFKLHLTSISSTDSGRVDSIDLKDSNFGALANSGKPWNLVQFFREQDQRSYLIVLNKEIGFSCSYASFYFGQRACFGSAIMWGYYPYILSTLIYALILKNELHDLESAEQKRREREANLQGNSYFGGYGDSVITYVQFPFHDRINFRDYLEISRTIERMISDRKVVNFKIKNKRIVIINETLEVGWQKFCQIIEDIVKSSEKTLFIEYISPKQGANSNRNIPSYIEQLKSKGKDDILGLIILEVD